MPELPEVEVVRRGLERHVVGRRLASVEVLHPRPVRRHLGGAADFAGVLEGRVVTGARRRGKFLWLPLDSGDALLAHLGMSGQLLVQPAEMPSAVRPFLRFETLTLAPFDLRLVDPAGLSDAERGWLDAYHARVLAEVGQQVGADARAWLLRACRPFGPAT